ncbi:MAG: prephenate dehydratase domain-containing protein [Coprococcus sp.]
MEEIQKLEAEIKALTDKRLRMIEERTDVDFLKEFSAVDKLNVTDNTVVVYQGVPGAYSHQAMHDFFGKTIKNINVSRFEDVIEAVKQGNADYGVLPIENSSAGFVNGIYDMVGNSGLTIVGEEEVKVAHALLGVPGATLSDITDVYSHPQGLMQCKDFLDESGFARHNVTNTAVGAVQVMEEGNVTKAAIASELAAEIYGLSILKKDIVNNHNNTTRFVILSRDKIYVKNRKNITIRFSLPHESGTLYNILGHINLNGINMTSIESRPLKGKKWEYSFFITMDGCLEDAHTINALMGICNDSTDFRLIGTY